MTFTIPPDLELALKEAAQHKGTTPEALALHVLFERFPPTIIPQDDWERDLLSIGSPIGANLSDEALSRENLYD